MGGGRFGREEQGKKRKKCFRFLGFANECVLFRFETNLQLTHCAPPLLGSAVGPLMGQGLRALVHYLITLLSPVP